MADTEENEDGDLGSERAVVFRVLKKSWKFDSKKGYKSFNLLSIKLSYDRYYCI